MTHLEALQYLVKTLEEGNLAELVYQYDSNARKNLWKWQGVVEESIAQLSPIVGDFLTNASACLDHIIYSLLGGIIGDRDIQWPVSNTPHDWSSAKGRLKGLPPEAFAIIEDYQPSERPNFHLSYCTSILRAMVNIDKHRRLIVVGLPIEGASHSGIVPGITYDFVSPPKTGAIFASVDGEQVDMPLLPHLHIGFGEGGVLNRQHIMIPLWEIRNVVEEALSSFERQFP